MKNPIPAGVTGLVIGLGAAAASAGAEPLPVTGFLPLPSSVEFTRSVAIAVSGDLALVGTPHDDSLGENAGLVRVLDISDPTTPVQIGTLSPLVPIPFGFFGDSVEIDGGVVVVGAPGTSFVAGSAYVFDLATGAELAILSNPQGGQSENFGSAVAIRGDRLLVGAPTNTLERPGYAMLYDIEDIANPTLLARLERTDAVNAADSFGFSLAFAGDVAIVGVPGLTLETDISVGDGIGRVRLYDGRDGSEISEINIPGGQLRAKFGISIDTSGDRLLVGASSESTTEESAGAAYLYDLSDPKAPQLLRTVRDPQPVQAGNFGLLVRLGEVTAAISSTDSTDGEGLPSLTTFSPDLAVLTARCAVPNLDGEPARFALGLAVEGPVVIGGWTRSASSFGTDYFGVTTHLGPAVCGPADLAGPFGTLDMFDVAAFLGLFNDQADAADLAVPFGVWNFLDVSTFLSRFNTGCP